MLPDEWPHYPPDAWPRDRGKARIVVHGEPDHRGYCFHDILYWTDGRRRRVHRCAFDTPPSGELIEVTK